MNIIYSIHISRDNRKTYTQKEKKIAYLKRQLILFLISKRPHFRNNITEIIFNKHDCRTKSSTNSLFILVRQFIRVITEIAKKKNNNFECISLTYSSCLMHLLLCTYSFMLIFDGISDQRRAYFTGVTCSCGSLST